MSEFLNPVPSSKSDVVRRVQSPGVLQAAGAVPIPALADDGPSLLASAPSPAPLSPGLTPPQPLQAPARKAPRRRRGSAGEGASAPLGTPRRPERSRGFTLSVEGKGELGCVDVRGFREAAIASLDPRALAPQRLVLITPSEDLCAFLEAWAEDTEQVRRTLLIARRFDGRAFRAVATVASHGFGVETSLALESISVPEDDGEHEIFRSGVHLKIDIEAALARYGDEAAPGPLDPLIPLAFD